ncbi:hypothetical protein ACFQH6_16455 [Halobacteriaceae archaeon GCM10025711]
MRLRIALASLLVVSGIALAGCAGAPSATDTGDNTTVSTRTTTQSTTEHVSESVVAYTDLAPEARRVFRWAVENGTVSGLTGLDSQAVEPLFENDYVRYDTTRYRIHAQRTLDPSLVVMSVTTGPANRSDPVVAYENLMSAGQATIRAIADGNATDPSFDPVTSPLAGNITDSGYAYVRYENQTYRLRLARGDSWSYRFSAENETT